MLTLHINGTAVQCREITPGCFDTNGGGLIAHVEEFDGQGPGYIAVHYKSSTSTDGVASVRGAVTRPSSSQEVAALKASYTGLVHQFPAHAARFIAADETEQNAMVMRALELAFGSLNNASRVAWIKLAGREKLAAAGYDYRAGLGNNSLLEDRFGGDDKLMRRVALMHAPL